MLWLCAEIDLPYVQEEWGAGFRSTQVPEFLALNPNASVPVIVDDGFRAVGVECWYRYLAAQYQRRGSTAEAPLLRAIVEQWMDWQSSELNGVWRYAFMGLVRHSPEHGDAAAIRVSVENWTRKMAILEGQLAKTGAFVAGSSFTLADIVIGLSVNRWFMTPIDRFSPPSPSMRASG